MKLTFFLVTLFLVLLSAYLAIYVWHPRQNQGTMIIGADDDHVKIQWSGKIVFTDDEKGIKSISPGGYLRLRHKDVQFAASADVKGEISYDMSDDDEKMSLDEKGRNFIARCVTDILAYGFDAEGRMDRIYGSGGDSALLSEAARQRGDGLRAMYIERALKDGRLSDAGLLTALGQIGTMQNNWDRSRLLKGLIGSGPLSDTLFTMVMRVAGQMNADYDKSELYKELIDKQALQGAEWITLLDACSGVNGEFDRANLLVQIGHKMPKTEPLRAAFVRAAGTIHEDSEYGRAMRAIQDTL